ncbi:hypothetical protein niasHT_029702 [Heterodera trifolii]|uniref:Uncharacterized protein n=1 Tax=Heterodera trifolii TaxID=157864 RepID=A0ABD2KJ49_9BILA
MGEKAITEHIKTTKHKKNLAEFNRSVPLTDFVKLKSASEEKRCLAAELTLAYHCARHNFSMNSANCSSELFDIGTERQKQAFLKCVTNLVGIGCSSHICNNAIGYAVEKCDYDVRNFSRTIADHFSNHPGRWELFQEMAAEENVTVHILPAYTAIRWMSLGRTFKRIREMWTVLEKYFRNRQLPFPILAKQIKTLKTKLELSLNEEFYGEETSELLKQLENDGAIYQKNKLKAAFKQFYEDAYEYLGNWSRQFSKIDEVIGDWVIFESEPTSEKFGRRIGIFVVRQLKKWMLCLGR